MVCGWEGFRNPQDARQDARAANRCHKQDRRQRIAGCGCDCWRSNDLVIKLVRETSAKEGIIMNRAVRIGVIALGSLFAGRLIVTRLANVDSLRSRLEDELTDALGRRVV